MLLFLNIFTIYIYILIRIYIYTYNIKDIVQDINASSENTFSLLCTSKYVSL